MVGTLTPEQCERYSRHLILPEIGPQGQARLLKGKILIIGAGGLGCPIAMYLSAAGVGRLGLCDFDVVDRSNLQRQVLYGTKDLGAPKVEIAAERLRDMNPDITVDCHPVRVTSQNIMSLIEPYDLVIDGTDNFPTRYLTNDACVLAGKPNVYGSIFRFEGQATVFHPPAGPCYRCLYPEPPPPDTVPSCAEGGVLGVLPGMIGQIQATETIKLLTGQGESLLGRFLVYDALAMRFNEFKIQRNPRCLVCGDNPTVTELIDYEAFCGGDIALSEQQRGNDETWTITVEALEQLRQRNEAFLLLDVREPFEFDIVQIAGARLLPLSTLRDSLGDLAGHENDRIVVYCHHGKRSERAVALLKQHGFQRAWSLAGGIDAWAGKIEPGLPRY